MKKYIFILVLLFPDLIYSQTILKDSSTKGILINSHKDTIVIIKQIATDSITDKYQQILEKTNSQLGLWSNPYGIIIGIIGILITLLGIAVAFFIYKQSEDAKDQMKESMLKHEISLEGIVSENARSLKNYQATFDSLIKQYEAKLKTPLTEDGKKDIVEFISKLEEQKALINSRIYKQSGWAPEDILENYLISDKTFLTAKISLNKPTQMFVIYIRIITSDSKRYWLGFSGNIRNTPGKSKDEYTQHKLYNLQEVTIRENIIAAFKLGFPEVNSTPLRIDTVRLRGSDIDTEEITFSYKIE